MNNAGINTDCAVIDQLGGPTKLAARLGYDVKAGGVQRVQNWRKRGIPAAVKVEHPDLFLLPHGALGSAPTIVSIESQTTS